MKKIVIDGIEYELKQAGVTPEKIFVEEVKFPKMEIHLAPKKMPWEKAMDYAKNLGDGWRLPTKEELQAYAPQLKKMGVEGTLWSGSRSPTTPIMRGSCPSAMASPSTTLSTLAMMLSVCGLEPPGSFI